MRRLKSMQHGVLLLVLLLLLAVFLLLKLKKLMNPSQRILQKANELGFSDNQAKLILAQAKHETGNFLSPLFVAWQNCFGMRPAQTRQADQKNYKSKDAYAHYDSIEQSVNDLALWFDAVGFVWYETPNMYASELKRHNYYEDTVENYSNDLSLYYYG
jgi:flagellum-specific peptidoglycan hydrolase FlgJ